MGQVIDNHVFVYEPHTRMSNVLSVMKSVPCLGILMWLFMLKLLPGTCWALFPAPDPSDWPLPYVMLKEKNLKGNEGWKWEVFAAYQGAPIERGRGATPSGNDGLAHTAGEIKSADYLERFVVHDRLSTKLQIRSMVDGRMGWMDMRDLLLFARPLRNPRDIALKAFLRVDLGRRSMATRQGEEKGIDLLRFRDGPGIPGLGNNYGYLVSKDDVNQVSSLFLYIYAVHFNNGWQATIAEMQEDISKYIHLYNNLDKVDYVLLGTGLSFNAEDLSSGEKIRGWLTTAAVQYWETRQAVEQIPGTPAHQFKNRSDLLRYFALTSPQQREEVLHHLESEGKVQRAMGIAVHLRGQDMRYLVLDRNTQQMDTVLAGVSDIAKLKSGDQNPSDSAAVNINQRSLLSQGLADAQEASKFVDLFFLVDGTTSMEGPVESAAEVIEKLTKQVRGLSDVKVSIRAAVFRDQKDETNPPFEDWDPRQGSPSDWLRDLLRDNRICSGSDLDFDESLFYGIRSAIRSWKKSGFQHTDSLRVMFVLGDAGDNSKDLEAAKKTTRLLVQQEDIFLFPIHFNHPLKDDGYKQLGPLSKLGALCEKEQWQDLIDDGMYDSDDARQEATEKYDLSLERISMCSFIKQMTELAKRDKYSIEVMSLTSNNFGNALAKSISKHITGAIEMIRTLRKIRQGRLNLDEAEEEMSRHGDIAMGIFQHRLQQMKREIPDLARMLEQRPELAYSELYIAEEDADRKLLRPVLLISQRELGKIVASMGNYIDSHRQCSPATVKYIVAESLTTFLGELLQLDPDLVDDDDIKKWTKLAVDGTDSYLGDSTPTKLIEEYCRDNSKWVSFLRRLRQAVRSLNPLLGDKPHPRRFRDISGTVYFWLYPEELFPIPD